MNDKCQTLKPLGRLCMTIGQLPASYVESMSYYEQLIWLTKFLQEQVIPVVNHNSTIVNELQDYIEHYFDNLDVQEEINNKLDEMADSGELTDIIAQYLGLAGMITFNSIAEMKLAENLVNGSKCATLGYASANDGGNALYRIRNVTNEDVEDDMFIIALHNPLLVAELIHDKEINVLKLGIKNDGVTDNSTRLQSIMGTLTDGTLYFPKGKYIFNTNIDCSGKTINFKGDFDYTYTGTNNYGLCFDGINGFINTGRVDFDGLMIQDTTTSHTGDGIQSSGGTKITNCCIVGFANAINGNYKSVFVERCNLHYNNRGIYRPIDSRIINNTINANEVDGVYLDEGCNDNIVSNNKVEWNKRHGIVLYKATNNVISNNVIDRQTEYGISLNQCGKNIINGNYLRRNNINTTVGANQCQVKIEACNDILFTNNNLSKGNSQDDGSGVMIPVYALYIVYSHDLLFMGNDFKDSCTEATPINIYQGGDNIQFFDLGFDIPSMLTGSVVSGSVSTATPLTLQVAGDKAAASSNPKVNRYLYTFRRTDNGAYEAGEILLSNFALWGSDSSTSAKMSINSFISGNVTATITYDRTTEKYNIVFTSTSGTYVVRITPLYI